MLLASSLLIVLGLVKGVVAKSLASFEESLTLHPLPDGKLSVLFEFTTRFAQTPRAQGEPVEFLVAHP